MSYRYQLGLIVNPLAGLGGSVALKGSDGLETALAALARGAQPRAPERVAQTLKILQPYADRLQFKTGSGALGADLLEQLGFAYEVVYQGPQQGYTSAEDTRQLAAVLAQQQRLDLLLFAGGDGTARDICSVYSQDFEQERPVLGIPAGVKIHSGVYAVSPTAAGRVIEQIIQGKLTTVTAADVMDIDEAAFRQGTVRAKRYGEMLVPAELRYVQAVKMGGKESDELVLADIAADVIERMEDDHLYIMGSGSTVDFIMTELDLPNTLLGVDVVKNQQVIATDATAQELLDLVEAHAGPVTIVVTVIGGQGHIFGRGNQQLSAQLLRRVGRDNIWIVASKNKLQGLGERPLRMDSGDPELNHAWSGMIRVICGYHDEVFVTLAGD
ncbi:ATP-NAD kinase family protein [Pseudidiomarina taiwanensis]|uniref:ATP-NAD kinase n=1 Tax=Pseudidiomarina taiwanensis TaxID=337250 RepID=A0A432ZNQ6_9GAMM|nr:ATP-NAD kinase family protein [Pseudidiomarina taiwanensis]RUO79529.1 ATP-NAD kinase [Pseudidiomarina taiwanensis]